ncbi:hypothetical protein G0U57_013071, partial [Chelydra serpentina]
LLAAQRPRAAGGSRGNRPDPAWSGASSHPTGQRGARGNPPSWAPAAGSPPDGAGERRRTGTEADHPHHRRRQRPLPPPPPGLRLLQKNRRKESESVATVYPLEGKQLDVLPQEPDPGAEGLTYAELDGQGLQAKRGGPAPAPEPVLYATINVSREHCSL